MRKLFLAAALCYSATMMSQVPNEMSYQIMVLDPDNGKVIANKEAEICIELRKGSPTGDVAWSKTFTSTTDQRGICNLTLEVGNEVNWSDGEYYFATIINGKECGAPKITSVPYAFRAATAQTATTAATAYQASSLKGLPTREQLIGTWIFKEEKTYECYSSSYIFNEDGTGEYIETDLADGSGFTYTFLWKYNPNGLMFLDIQELSSRELNVLCVCLTSESQAFFITIDDEGMEKGIYNKQ